MATSTRLSVLQTLVERLEAIQVADGFNTDAGKAIFLGMRPSMGPEDPPIAIAVMVGEEEPNWLGEKCSYELPIDIQALAQVELKDLQQPWLAVEAIIADVKRAVELQDRRLGGVALGKGIRRIGVRALPRESGSRYVGAGLTYLVPLAEVWGNP